MTQTIDALRRRRRPLVMVEWRDSASLGGGRPWHPAEACAELEPHTLVSVGWVMVEDAARLVLFAHTDRCSQVAGEICIPKACVVRRWRLPSPLHAPRRRKRRKAGQSGKARQRRRAAAGGA
jgi:hypothetical protein